MQDSEHLSKLINHVEPMFFETFMADYFGISLFQMLSTNTKRELRHSYVSQLSELKAKERIEIERLAERVLALADGPGQDAVESLRCECLSFEERRELDKLANQYERSLWLYANARQYFDEALNIRLADIYRQSTTCYSGYVGPIGLVVEPEQSDLDAFHKAVAQMYACDDNQVAVEVFKRYHLLDEGELNKVSLYQICVHYNLAPQSVEWVNEAQLDSQQVTKAQSSFVTYEPENGHIEVMSKNKADREALAQLSATHLMPTGANCEPVAIKRYDYQCLAQPCQLDIRDENIAWAKVTQLGFNQSGSSVVFKVNQNSAEDIYTAATNLIGPSFSFNQHTLNFVQLSIRSQRQFGERARTIHITLRGENGCNIKTKRERDRQLCDRLLHKWGIVRDVNVGGDDIAEMVA